MLETLVKYIYTTVIVHSTIIYIMTEVFKEIKGFEGRYEISNLGNVKSLLTGKLMKLGITPFGYLRVNLRYANCRKYKSYFVHRLVASAFIPNPKNYKEVNHKDSNRQNNKVTNLEWCTREENIRHSFKFGNASNKGLRNPNAKLNLEDVEAIKALAKTNRFYHKKIAKFFRISSSMVDNIVKGNNWSNN